MDAARYEAIARRPGEEGARESFPDGFPDPIDVPAARYTDPGFLVFVEDTVVITEDGYENLTAAAPYDMDEVEAVIREGGGPPVPHYRRAWEAD